MTSSSDTELYRKNARINYVLILEEKPRSNPWQVV